MKVIKKRILTNYTKSVFDLRIKDNHNYYITKSNILVHNSGKTYVLSKVKSGRVEPKMVNTDRSFPLFKEWWHTDWPKIRTKVKTISANQLASWINSMLPLAIDGTAVNTSTVLKRMGILESFGYDIAMVFVNTSLETALERASKRERKVDPEFIKKVYGQIQEAKQFYRSRFRTWIEVDNDEGQLTDEVVLRAFKFLGKFYHEPVENPVGKDHIKVMKENGWKYLSPNVVPMEEIKRKVSIWYSR